MAAQEKGLDGAVVSEVFVRAPTCCVLAPTVGVEPPAAAADQSLHRSHLLRPKPVERRRSLFSVPAPFLENKKRWRERGFAAHKIMLAPMFNMFWFVVLLFCLNLWFYGYGFNIVCFTVMVLIVFGLWLWLWFFGYGYGFTVMVYIECYILFYGLNYG